jgi:orotate phosphoribosyltransferase
MDNLTEEKKQSISNQLAQMLIDLKVFDLQSKIIDIDVLWTNSTNLEHFSNLVAEYIKLLDSYGEIKCIVGLVKVRFPFGCVPIAVWLSKSLSLPLVIWKENANVITGHASAYRLKDLKDKEGLLVLHDVTQRGITLLRVARYFNEKGYKIKLFLSIVDREVGSQDDVKNKLIEKTGQMVDFESILSLSKLIDMAKTKK